MIGSLKGSSNRELPSSSRAGRVWCPPARGCLKLNIDGSVSVERKQTGMRAVLCDENGSIVFSRMEKREALLDVLLT